jgi:hypothetical protein
MPEHNAANLQHGGGLEDSIVGHIVILPELGTNAVPRDPKSTRRKFDSLHLQFVFHSETSS